MKAAELANMIEQIKIWADESNSETVDIAAEKAIRAMRELLKVI